LENFLEVHRVDNVFEFVNIIEAVQEQQLALTYQQEASTQWNHRNNNSAAQQPRITVDRTFSSYNGHHHPSPHYSSSAAVGAKSIEVVTIKTPHRQNEIPETSI
jgi:hypothetical protein